MGPHVDPGKSDDTKEAQHELRLFFCLGKADDVRKLAARFPDGLFKERLKPGDTLQIAIEAVFVGGNL
jgi:hypothetical protein